MPRWACFNIFESTFVTLSCNGNRCVLKKYVSRYMPFDGSSVDVRIECSKKFDHTPVNVNAYLAYIIFPMDNFYQLSVWDTFNAVTMFENYPSYNENAENRNCYKMICTKKGPKEQVRIKETFRKFTVNLDNIGNHSSFTLILNNRINRKIWDECKKLNSMRNPFLSKFEKSWKNRDSGQQQDPSIFILQKSSTKKWMHKNFNL